MDEFSAFAGVPFKTVDIATVEVLVGGLLGTMMVFFFTGLAVAAVGDTAGEVVLEVRRQFALYPGIMEYKQKPDYRTCVALVTKAALKQMRLPGLLAVLMPVAVGLVFRIVRDSCFLSISYLLHDDRSGRTKTSRFSAPKSSRGTSCLARSRAS